MIIAKIVAKKYYKNPEVIAKKDDKRDNIWM
jgi:hypothetical protein